MWQFLHFRVSWGGGLKPPKTLPTASAATEYTTAAVVWPRICQRVNTGESYIFYFGIYLLWAFKRQYMSNLRPYLAVTFRLGQSWIELTSVKSWPSRPQVVLLLSSHVWGPTGVWVFPGWCGRPCGGVEVLWQYSRMVLTNHSAVGPVVYGSISAYSATKQTCGIHAIPACRAVVESGGQA